MRAVLTRVKHASVTIDGEVHGQIGEGFLILLGVTHEDTEAQAVKLADKLTGLRIFEDENGKMNRSLAAVPSSCPPHGRRWPSPCTRSSSSSAGTRASTPRPASSAPICRWRASTTGR